MALTPRLGGISNDTAADSSSDESGEARRRWKRDRTTFQRVYDVMTGVTEHASASEVAERADCSPDGARNALTQLAELGIVDRRGGRPAEYRRNKSYFEWKRVETLADDHTAAALRERLDDLLAKDADL